MFIIYNYPMITFNIWFDINAELYKKDPQATNYGKRLILESINLFEELGFETFTFKKLATKISSTEASIYRYFENKHLLLLYLVVWYWNWVTYLIDYNTKNIDDPEKRLDIIIDNFVDATKENPAIDFVNEKKLHQIIIAESSKAYHTKSVDAENREGLFKSYKALIQKVADVVLEIDPKFPYPHSFASNLFEMVNNQIFFAEHLPRLTNVNVKKGDYEDVKKLLMFYKTRMLKGCGNK